MSYIIDLNKIKINKNGLNKSKMEINNRIKQIRIKFKITQQKFAELLGISRGYLNNIEAGKPPSFNFIMKLIKSTNCNSEWLLIGKGEMYRHELEKTDKTMEELLSCLEKHYKKSNDKEKIWMEIQLKKTFPNCDK
jgi:transcriptional regulator with XRE-family HTH domain